MLMHVLISCFSPGEGIQADLKTKGEKEIAGLDLFLKYIFSTLNCSGLFYIFSLCLNCVCLAVMAEMSDFYQANSLRVRFN